MKWNERKEKRIFDEQQKERRKFYLSCGMTEDEISVLEDEEREQFNRRRNETRFGFETGPQYYVDEEGEEKEIDSQALSYTEDICEDDPFQYGFKDNRLNKIVAQADETDMEILRLLSKGLNQRETGETLGLSQQVVSYRIKRFRKRLK